MSAWVVMWPLAPLVLAFVVPDRFTLSLLALAAAQALYVAGWGLLAGQSGQVSLGHALPFGGGAYATALLSVMTGLPPVTAVVGGAAAGAVAGTLQGIAGARLPRALLAVVTLATAECAHEVSGMLVIRAPSGVVFGGTAGVPMPLFPGDEAGAARLAAVALAGGLIGLVWLARSRLGLAMRTVHAGHQVARASGIDPTRVRLAAFVLAGAIAGLAGGLMAGQVGRASPSMLSLDSSLFAVAAATVGGVGTGLGPAAAAYVLTIGLQWADLPDPLRLALYSLLLLGVGMAAPERAFLVSLWTRARGSGDA